MKRLTLVLLLVAAIAMGQADGGRDYATPTSLYPMIDCVAPIFGQTVREWEFIACAQYSKDIPPGVYTLAVRLLDPDAPNCTTGNRRGIGCRVVAQHKMHIIIEDIKVLE